MKKFSINEHYVGNKLVAIVPVKSFHVEKKLIFGNTIIFPEKSLDEDEIRGWHFNLDFEEIKSDFYNSSLLTFTVEDVALNYFGVFTPSQKHDIIKKVLGSAEDIMNIFRYMNSNFDKSSNLPQRAGYIKDILCGFLLYSTEQKKSDYISGKYYSTSYIVTQGLTIYEDIHEIDNFFKPFYSKSHEVGSIIMHALRMYSDILYMQSPTNKFMQAMSLIEYLANPFEYEQMKKAKTKIIPFSADSKSSYLKLCDRFKELTSAVDENGQQVGLRTCIVHNGKTLEDLIDKSYKIDLLLRELQSYICNFINFAINYSDQEWTVVVEKTKEKYNEIQGINQGYTGKYESDTAIIIDADFLNLAIQEVYNLYPQYSDREIDIAKFLLLLLKQSDIERPNYQIPVQLIYSYDKKLYKCSPCLKISELEGKGFDSPLGETSIYTFATGNNHSYFLQQLLIGYLSSKNCFIDIGSKFNNIIFISDRNNIPDEIFKTAEASCKKMILGRLDNKRTTCYDACTWFDIELLIMSCIGIELYEECEDNFIFNVEDGKYPGA